MKNIVEKTRQMNKMGTADIKKLMLSMGLPMIVSMALQAVTAYGIYYKIQQFVFFGAFGMNNAMLPIIAFNYGMRSKKRINQGIRYGMIYTLIIMLLGAILLQVFANQILGIFSLSDKTRELAVLAIRIITLGYLFVGANVAYQGIFQALGCGVSSLVLSLIRLIVVPLPLAAIFTCFANAETLIWIAFPVGELAAFLVALVMMKFIGKRKIAPIKARAQA